MDFKEVEEQNLEIERMEFRWNLFAWSYISKCHII